MLTSLYFHSYSLAQKEMICCYNICSLGYHVKCIVLNVMNTDRFPFLMFSISWILLHLYMQETDGWTQNIHRGKTLFYSNSYHYVWGGGGGGKECKSYTVHVHLHVLLACTVPCTLCRVPTHILDYFLPVHAMYMYLISTTRFVKPNECE